MEITEEQAAGISRQEALRALAAMGERRAQLMLAGPEITDADMERLRSFRPQPTRMHIAVRLALMQLGAEIDEERARARLDALELAGHRG